MEKHDVLKALIEGQITDEQAEDILNEILTDMSRNVPVHEALGMSRYEWTAYAHGSSSKKSQIGVLMYGRISASSADSRLLWMTSVG